MGWDGPLTHVQALAWRQLLFPDEPQRRPVAQLDPPMPDDEWYRQLAESRKMAALNDPSGDTVVVNLKPSEAKLMNAADLLRAGVSRRVNPTDKQAAVDRIKAEKQYAR